MNTLRFRTTTLCIFGFLLGGTCTALAGESILTPRVESALARLSGSAEGQRSNTKNPSTEATTPEAMPDSPAAEQTLSVWLYFQDKGEFESMKASVPLTLVTERSLRRRQKNNPNSPAVDYTDMPVSGNYIEALRPHVTRVRQRSKWFNSVSVDATPAQVQKLSTLPFLTKIDLVAKMGGRDRIDTPPQSPPSTRPRSKPGSQKPALFNYGASFDQLNQIKALDLHNMNFTGAGVMIGHFDNGHRLLSHESLAGLNIAATFDFVDHDIDTAPNPGDPASWGAHGILTLSALAGFKQGELIGPAFGATYLLARTENDASETPLEEDNWVAAIEWADSIGVDITSTSLGYRSYDPPFASWSWSDMDGNTTVITRAADIAAARGILVVTSVGNGGNGGDPNTLMAPSDGDSVMAVGAVDVTGARPSFSSFGPSVDGRIKPDLMARGVLVHCATPAGATQYANINGTSLACPLAAGVAALLLEAVPSATAMQLLDALRTTSSQNQSPDNLMGWGIIDAVAALNQLMATDTETPGLPTGYRLTRAYPNPFNPGSTIRFDLPQRSWVRLSIFDARGRLIRSLLDEEREPRTYQVIWNGQTNDGQAAGSGAYFVHMNALDSGGSEYEFSATQKLILVR